MREGGGEKNKEKKKKGRTSCSTLGFKALSTLLIA